MGDKFKAEALAAEAEAKLETVVATRDASRAVKEVEVLKQVATTLNAKSMAIEKDFDSLTALVAEAIRVEAADADARQDLDQSDTLSDITDEKGSVVFDDGEETFSATAQGQLGSGASFDDDPLAPPGSTKTAPSKAGSAKGAQRRAKLVPISPPATAGASQPMGKGETKEGEDAVEPAKGRTGAVGTAGVGGRAPG